MSNPANREWLETITADVHSILPPNALVRACRQIGDQDDRFERVIFGQSEQGVPLEAFIFGSGERSVLLYGFPDPGEAIGGTTILTLMKQLSLDNPLLARMGLHWVFVPCLNPDDQPYNGEQLQVVSKRGLKEIDWCLDNPRNETIGLLTLSQTYQPSASFPLHDEFHSGETIAAYIALSHAIASSKADRIRMGLLDLGFEVSGEYHHPSMGSGFFVISEQSPREYLNSTFSILAQSGLVAICELSTQPHLPVSRLVQAQINFVLCCLEEL